MWFSWQAGAKTMENVTFGEQAQPNERGGAPRTGSAGSWFFRAFKGENEATGTIPAERARRTDNLTNNNIYIYKNNSVQHEHHEQREQEEEEQQQ